MSHRLTQTQKRKWLPILEEYYGPNCFYCEVKFRPDQKGMEKEFDHLNCKEYDNRIENVVQCHSICNRQKKGGAPYYIMKARKQIDFNNKNTALQDILQNRKIINELEEKNVSQENEEIFSHQEYRKITETYLAKEINQGNPSLPYTSTLNDLTLKCDNEVGHASQNTIRRILDMISAKSGRYQIIKDGGKRFITRRIDLT